MARIGGNAQDRRRARRAAERRQDLGTRRAAEAQLAESVIIRPEVLDDFASLAAAASGSTSLPLSDRDTAWDAAAAEKRVRDWAGATDAPNAKYASAFLWKDPEQADSFGGYKLGFADVVDGKLTAVFRGVTAAAGAIQGARGGVKIPDGDVASVKSKIAGYYSKAAKAYDDAGIKPPWSADGESSQTPQALAAKMTLAELGVPREALVFDAAPKDATVQISFAADAIPAIFKERYLYWMSCFALAPVIPAEIAELAASYVERHFADADARVTVTVDTPDQATADGDDHLGMGRFIAELAADQFAIKAAQTAVEAGEIADADFSLFEKAWVAAWQNRVGIVAEFLENGSLTTLWPDELSPERRALAAIDAFAAGDVSWGPEEGFVDLLCDVNEALGGEGSSTAGSEDVSEYRPGPRAIDVGVKLDKVLLCDYTDGDYYVASLKIGAAGEPIVGDRSSWTPVEQGWVEVPAEGDVMTASNGKTTFRFSLQNLVFADGATTPMLPEAHKPGETMPKRNKSPMAPPPLAAPADEQMGGKAWTAVFVVEGELTEDGRAFAPDSLTWRDLPLSLMAMTVTSEGGHIGAEVAGRIDKIWREGDLIYASGVFDSGEYGEEIARMVADGVLRGLSIDVAPLEYERTPRSDWFDADGNWIALRNDEGDWIPAGGEERTEDDAIAELFGAAEDSILVFTKAVIGMATVCPFPAFARANISLTASGSVWTYTHQGQFCVIETVEPALTASAAAPVEAAQADADCGCDESLTAAAAGHAQMKPPAEWFSNPEFEELTPLTITEDGQIFGHAWAWDSCHMAFDECVRPPRSKTDYAYFHLGQIECEDGSLVDCGKATLDAPHAGQRLSREAAIRHYDHTGTVVAHLAVGEDEFGGWFAGAVDPEISDHKLRLLRGGSFSGDWRGVDGNLELIALLTVNVPGFPVPRPRALVADAFQSLTAAGIVPGTPEMIGQMYGERESAEEAADFSDLTALARG